MGYQTIRERISSMLTSKGFILSSDVTSFTDESDTSIDKRFRIERPLINFEGDGVEFLINLVRPKFEYRIFLGFKLGVGNKRQFDYDVSQNLIDVLTAYFNNPINYSTYCIKMQFLNIETKLVDDHLEAEILLEVIDDITLT